MKMNPATWIFIVASLIGIGATLMVMNTAGGFVSIFILAFLAIMFFFFYKFLIGPVLNANRLRKTGIPGKARIIAVKDTGITINNNPVARLEVEVKDNFGQRYNTSIKVLVPRINPTAYTPGMEVPVKIDPQKQLNVIIDPDAQQGSASAIKTELEKMQEENKALFINGTRARAIVKKYNWLGTYANGNDPFIELDLEVLPEHSIAFGGKARTVIPEASVHKFQPGSEIYVKYDLYDNSKIIIDQD